MEHMVKRYFLESASVSEKMTAFSAKIMDIAELLVKRLNGGNKILVCGNGGSSSQSSHMVGELLGRFERERKGIPCLSLSSDTAFTTAWANDYDYASLFERGVASYGCKGDVLIALSTSGQSTNIKRALKRARELQISTISLLGKDGGEIEKSGISDMSIVVPHENTAHIQEAHLMIIHVLCKIVEDRLFANG